MTTKEALILLNTDLENYEEVVLEKLFEHKQFLLKSSITPQVFKTRAQKLKIIGEAFEVLNNELGHKTNSNKKEFPIVELPKIDFTKSSLLIFYRVYESNMSQLKLVLMQSIEPNIVAEACLKLAILEDDKLNKIAIFSQEWQVEDEVKISDFVNSGLIIKELKDCRENFIDLKILNSLPTFKKEVVKSKKYHNFTLSKENKE